MTQTVRAVERAIAVLQVLSDAGTDLGVSEIGRRLKLSKSTVHRLLSVLRRQGVAQMNPETHAYSLGYRLLQYASVWLDRVDLRTRALPHLRRLREECGETVSLNLLVNGQRVAIERLDSSHEMRFVVDLGKPLPLVIGATGKAILAFLPDDDIHEQLKGLPPAHAAGLRREIPEIRRRGFAVSHGERIPGSGSVSAAIRDHAGRVVASVSILAPSARWTQETSSLYQALVVETAAAISQDLGFIKPAQATAQPGGRRRR